MGEHEDFYCGAVDSEGLDRNGQDPQGRPSVDCSKSMCCLMKRDGLIRVPEQLRGDSFVTGESFSLSPGGGGFGPAFERDPALVATDVRLGFVSRENATAQYGVVLADDGTVDSDATQSARATKGAAE